jgi:hypothetical protein
MTASARIRECGRSSRHVAASIMRLHPHVAGAGFPRSAPAIVIPLSLVVGQKG